MLSLAATLPMMAGRIDLTVGFGIVMWHILAISLQVWYGVPWPLAMIIVIACGGLTGLINGLLVEVAQIDSFIATLGIGTILYALALWLTDGRQVVGSLSPGFLAINSTTVFGIPIPAIYVLVLAIVLWIISERLPIGRHIYAIGANEKAAALNGIPVRAYVIGVFVGAGVITGIAGCVLGAKLRIGQANVGLDYLLPALVGAFLGSTTIKPGRVNIWGTICRRADSRGRNLRHPAAWRRLLCRASFQWRDAGHLDRARRLRSAPAQRRASGAGREPRRQERFRKGPGLNDGSPFGWTARHAVMGKCGATKLTGLEPAVM